MKKSRIDIIWLLALGNRPGNQNANKTSPGPSRSTVVGHSVKPSRSARPLTAGSATAQWRARSARRYPPPLDTLPTPYAALGKNELVGCQMALDEINAKGGILDHPVKLIVEDSTSADAGTAVMKAPS